MIVFNIPPVPEAGSNTLSISPLSFNFGLTKFTNNFFTFGGVKNCPNSLFLFPPAPNTASTNILSYASPNIS